MILHAETLQSDAPPGNYRRDFPATEC